MPYVAAEDLRNLQSQAAAGVQLRLRLQSQAAEMGTLRVRAAEAAALKQQVQRLAPKAAQASSLKLEIQQLEALLFASNRVSDDCPSGDIVTLVPRPPVFEDLNPGELRTYLRARGLPEDGRKEILVAKLETAFACSAVMASRSKLEAASDSLRQLVVSSVGGRVEWPSADIEAIRLLWQTLLSGDQCLHRRLTARVLEFAWHGVCARLPVVTHPCVLLVFGVGDGLLHFRPIMARAIDLGGDETQFDEFVKESAILKSLTRHPCIIQARSAPL